jgi:hypothetical protein
MSAAQERRAAAALAAGAALGGTPVDQYEHKARADKVVAMAEIIERYIDHGPVSTDA